MASDAEVFFIDSSAGEDDGSDSEFGSAALRSRASNSSGEAKSPADHPLPASPTMESVLFGLAPPKRRPNPFPSLAQRQQSGHAMLQTTLDDGTAATSCASANGIHGNHLPRQHAGGDDFPYAGGSPYAMPVKQLTPPSRSLAELRAMTSSDVREELERYFQRKDAFAKRFKAVEGRLLATNDEAVAPQLPPAPPSSTAADARAALLTRDRCRRLVNISNWDSAVNGYSQWDVLLPSVLLPDAVPANTASAASLSPSAANSPASAGSNRRTLRPHQIEGIRFLWSNLAEGPIGQVPAVGCILAHTMGLGKTGQVVAFLHLFMAAFQRRVEGSMAGASTSPPPPSSARLPRVLIVIPKSTQSGWMREFQTWSLGFPEEYRLHPLSVGEGLRPHQRVDVFRQWRRDGGVLLIGYEALVRLVQLVGEDSVCVQQHEGEAKSHSSFSSSRAETEQSAEAEREQHRRVLRERCIDEGGKASGGYADPFTELVVCDEAHRLKSVHLHVVQALRGLHPLRRLLLTGTPLQNHLQEYWAMMDFCIHKYFNRRRFREYFIQPIESSANTRASEKEVDLARKKTFTLINEVRHFVQRVDSTPLRNELPPLHEYVVVLPPSQLQKELYLRFITILQHNGTQKLQFLPAVSFSGKIAAHPQLLFQMHDQSADANSKSGGNYGRPSGSAGGRLTSVRKRVSDYWELERRNRQSTATANSRKQQRLLTRPLTKRARWSDAGSDGDGDDSTSREGSTDAVVISDSQSSSSSGARREAARAEVNEEFAWATKHSFSHLYPAPLAYGELCTPPSPAYVPRLEDGVKLHVAMKLIAAAMAQHEKVLLFSLSTQLLTFFEFLIAKVNVEWCRAPGASADDSQPMLLTRPIRYCRLDGSHTAARRVAMLDEFDSVDGPDLFLLSMKAGGVGVTITAATRVILVDTSFNPADDQQAVGRAYRYGQTRPVFVYRLMCYPTLEYSIFLQKLAKEWLFKTVVEESSVKRDGLSGMHLKELFSVLARAAKVLQRPLSATRAQTRATAEVLRDDPLLGAVQTELLYAQRYEMFLEQDDEDQYGAAEEEFYQDYCRSGLFGAVDDEDAERQRAADLLQRRQQRMDDATQLQAQSKTLSSMVDDLIRSRAGTDSQLVQLLSAMGLRVDPESGQVRTYRSSASPNGALDRSAHLSSSTGQLRPAAPLVQRNEGLAPSPIVLVGAADPAPPQPSVTHSAMAENSAGDAPSSRSPHVHNARQTAVLLLDSDDEGSSALPSPGEAGNGEGHNRRQQQRPQSGSATRARNSVSAADRIAASLSRQPYARYRPGGSPSRAVEIDSDASQ
ncbi:putative Helicase-like protein [Leptomonas seymouri]|uniref:Putative Helicase-like protein n=1 Tax=Leptomonas seymouri TaxID=5684 RepID=A0A0N1I5E7_LEPSE|nr:putative Helicase-like protein [Leptomonas seymouri]|eukprot:KPI86960.1 putative Helicase-like protein [Leptomonas seymouri]